MARRWLALILLLPALGLVATGCGEDRKESFKKDFKPLNDRILALGTDLAAALRGAPRQRDEQLQAGFAKLADRAESIRESLSDLKPPDDLKSSTEKLKASFGKVTGDIRRIEQSARAHSASQARSAARALVLDATKVRDPRRALARATGAKVSG
jgi:hypothetical protein